MVNKEEKIKRRLKRLEGQRDLLLDSHKGNEQKFTYWGGYDLGYIKGKINEIEDSLDDLHDVESRRHYKGLNEVIDSFKNGEERYYKSSTVNVIINSLVSGEDPIKLIDQLCQMNDDINDRFIEYVNNN